MRGRMQGEGLASEEARLRATVEAAAGGDRAAWDALVREFDRRVRAVARSHRLSEADVADVAQTTWMRLVEHIGRLHDPARVGAWLIRTARRESLRVLRRSRRHASTSELADLPGEEDVAGRVLDDERARALRTAFGRLAERDQRLLGLLMADGAPNYAHVSATLRMPVGSIGPTRARSLERLRREARRLGLEQEAPAPEPMVRRKAA